MACKTSKCGCKSHYVSRLIKRMNDNSCVDVCNNPICETPGILNILAPLIYDEIGINLCATFDLGVDIPTTYPTVTNASIQIVNITYEDGEGGITVESIAGRQHCYLVTLSNLLITFAVNLYDASCRLVDTIYPTATYLPPETDATYDEDTNPSLIELEIFAPYGLSYDTTGATPVPIVSNISFTAATNTVTQGLNLYGIPKLLNFDINDSSATVGITIVLQSLYFAGYMVATEGKIDTPKGCTLNSDNTDCIQFVKGELLNLAIKPLDLGLSVCMNNCGKEECCSQVVEGTITTEL